MAEGAEAREVGKAALLLAGDYTPQGALGRRHGLSQQS